MPAKARPKARAAHALVWERPEPAKRPAPEPLSREKIVRAALALADKKGLAAVSLRNVGAALDAGPMRLYGYLSTKEELLELMVDVVYAEMSAAGPIRGDWRKALRTVAHRMRAAAQHHPWFIELLGSRPHIGPNALAHLEASMAALCHGPGFDDIDRALQAGLTLNAYVIGALSVEASELRARQASGMDEIAWQRSTHPYMTRMIATGRLPTVARVMREANDPSADEVFESGLECVLDGIDARLRR
jgi:AcrR family transcriptional regulator